ncbi:hypothetical protein C475_00320 [Halosimplex carlsbadense 2-9-1]|uniref:Uncharacterized protein n=1 Tax=Halosimplex carlsbadense 2-9-1 TaxID=797114 RepID=M0D7A1_9EURY|nr:hypothetical protein [Halosimplex carlsbadense]ELZ30542.1 hypothetical protein C475_00320 [Halosimplex carlsbadense 2-9-1]
MTDHWYCLDCDRRIDPDDRSRHAAADHRLRGVPVSIRPSATAIRRADDGETARRADHGETAIRPVRPTESRLARRPGD